MSVYLCPAAWSDQLNAGTFPAPEESSWESQGPWEAITLSTCANHISSLPAKPLHTSELERAEWRHQLLKVRDMKTRPILEWLCGLFGLTRTSLARCEHAWPCARIVATLGHRGGETLTQFDHHCVVYINGRSMTSLAVMQTGAGCATNGMGNYWKGMSTKTKKKKQKKFGCTFSSFRGLLMSCSAVTLLLLHNSWPLLVKGHGAVLWQAVEFPFKLLLQLPKTGGHTV